jgi:hypothetical protein
MRGGKPGPAKNNWLLNARAAHLSPAFSVGALTAQIRIVIIFVCFNASRPFDTPANAIHISSALFGIEACV